MTGPTVRTSATGKTTNTGTSVTTGSMDVPSGDAVWVAVFEDNTSDIVNSVSDGVNTYNKKATYAVTDGTWVLYVADNVTGSSSLAVTVKTSSAIIYIVVALDIEGAANPSYDKAGSGNSGTYTSGTNEGDSLSPTDATDLLLLLAGFVTSESSGSPTITYNSVTGETLVNSASEADATLHVTVGGGVYSEAASGTGSQTLDGNATVTGTSHQYVVFLVAVLPAPTSGTGTGEGTSKATATAVGSGKGSGEGLSKATVVGVGSGKGAGEGLSKTTATAIGSGKGAGEGLSKTTASAVGSGKAAGEGLSKTTVAGVGSGTGRAMGSSRATAVAVAGAPPVTPSAPAVAPPGTAFWLGPHGALEAIAIGTAERFVQASAQLSNAGEGNRPISDTVLTARVTVGQVGSDNPLATEFSELLPEPPELSPPQNPLSGEFTEPPAPAKGPTQQANELTDEF